MSRDARDGERGRGRAGREKPNAAARDAMRIAGEVKRAAQEVTRAAQDVKDAAQEVRRAAREVPTELIWSRPQPGARRPRLTREEIAAAALALADAEGFQAVSMRRVAVELGVGTMTLYYYVQTKDELLALMNDAMMGEVLVPEGELPSDWRAALELIAHRSRAACRRHPWAITGSPGVMGPNAMRHFEQSLAAVEPLDLDFATRLEIISMVDDYVFGFALRELRDEDERLEQGGSDQWVQAMAGYVEAQLATGSFPQMERIVGGKGALAAIERLVALDRDAGRFERGLRRLLDGIALDLDRSAGRP
ncbi:MAG TPA: TetR/AcrR family transcriptional regulator C-terminal domain-containing protein [Solirubrobacteraceae bacterium]|nr:TetR/AcrR family transcriptional regulator C-terminal domain-containing protein [Solirubrobacteraceae bacterium]